MLDSKDFTPRLIAELDELYKTDKESLDRVVKEAVFRIFKARHKMIFYQYIQGEPFSMEVCIISMSIPEKEKGDEVSAPPTNREEEEDREDEVELLAGVSSEDCHPPEEREGEQREKGDESVIQKEKKDTTKPTEDEERFLAENLPSNHIRAQDKQKKDDSEPKIPQAQKTLEIAKQNCRELFVDQYGTPYAVVIVNEHLEVLSLNSKRFKNWLCKICYDTDNSIINSESLKNVINILKAQIEFGISSRTKELHLRVGSRTDNAEEDSAIYYDLTNSPWEVVKVTPYRWSIEKALILFRRYNNQRPQIYPSREYPQDIFDRFMELTNVKDEENKLLLKCYIISMFIPTIPKPVLILHGEQGSAKSTLLELIKTLINPSSITTLSFPRDTNELVQQAFSQLYSIF